MKTKNIGTPAQLEVAVKSKITELTGIESATNFQIEQQDVVDFLRTLPESHLDETFYQYNTHDIDELSYLISDEDVYALGYSDVNAATGIFGDNDTCYEYKGYNICIQDSGCTVSIQNVSIAHFPTTDEAEKFVDNIDGIYTNIEDPVTSSNEDITDEDDWVNDEFIDEFMDDVYGPEYGNPTDERPIDCNEDITDTGIVLSEERLWNILGNLDGVMDIGYTADGNILITYDHEKDMTSDSDKAMNLLADAGIDVVGSEMTDNGQGRGNVLVIAVAGEDSPRYKYLRSKSVEDYDGFLTEYTLYYDTVENKYVFVFGDMDFYTPEDGDFDYETESKEDALNWFDNYSGVGDTTENEDIYGSVHTTDAIDRDRYLHILFGDVDAKLMDLGISTTFSQDNTNLYVDVDVDGDSNTYEIPLLDLRFDYEDISQDVVYILNAIQSDLVDVYTAADTNNSGYMYYTKHGIGPGTLPKDVDLVNWEDVDANLTRIWTDRFLTTEELDEYDIYPETENSQFEDLEATESVTATTKTSSMVYKPSEEARELCMCTIHNGDSYSRSIPAIISNLRKKVKKRYIR